MRERFFEEQFVDPTTGKLNSKSRAVREFFQKINVPAKIQTQTIGTHAQRVAVDASKVTAGSTFIESDRGGLVYRAQNGVWTYHAGVFQVLQQNLPTDLKPSDVGTLVYVTDYAHLLQWSVRPDLPTGYGWNWGPGDSQSGFITAFVNAPPDNGWQLCDGSANVPQLQSDGSFQFVNVPNTPGSYFRQ